MDIKGVEGFSAKNIYRKFMDASGQGANTIVLYYHDESVFSVDFLDRGYNDYINEKKIAKNIKSVYYIVKNKLFKYK
jgi:hypothetical protein